MAAAPLPLDGGAPVAPRTTTPGRRRRPAARRSRAETAAVGLATAAPLPRQDPAAARGDDSAGRAPHLRAVPIAPAVRRGLPPWLYGAVAGTILAAGILGIVTLNALAAQASFQARAMESDISELTLRHDDLVAAVSTLAAPGRVREVATTSLGLIEPEQPGFLTLDPAHLVPEGTKPPVRFGE